jgi:DNA-binding ferritin-like protein (Dps family)
MNEKITDEKQKDFYRKMKNRIELYNIFYGKNYDKLYKGLSGFFFNQAHKNLENLNYNSNFIANKNNEKKQLI